LKALHVLPAIDAILSIDTFSPLSCVSLGLFGLVVVAELAAVLLLCLTLYLYLPFYLH